MKLARWVQELFGSKRAVGAGSPPDAEPAPDQSHGGEEARVELSAVPDLPIPLGYKINWLAVRADAAEPLAEALQLTDLQPANWATGLDAVREQRAGPLIFVSPPVSGWVLAVGSALPFPIDDEEYPTRRETGGWFDILFPSLVERFPEVAFFGTHRVVGFDAWARARNGVVERVFCFADGAVLANRGRQTAEEQALKLLDLGDRSPEAATLYVYECCEAQEAAIDALVKGGAEFDDAREQVLQAQGEPMVDEDKTMALAAAWSIDADGLDTLGAAPGVGLVGVLRRA